MVETPAAAILSDELAPLVDFFSIGTNDLTQYTLAVDRGNEAVADLYDAGHPAVLRLIRMTAENAHKNGIWVGVCGEAAASPALLQNFVDMGIDELSVSPMKVPSLKASLANITARAH